MDKLSTLKRVQNLCQDYSRLLSEVNGLRIGLGLVSLEDTRSQRTVAALVSPPSLSSEQFKTKVGVNLPEAPGGPPLFECVRNKSEQVTGPFLPLSPPSSSSVSAIGCTPANLNPFTTWFSNFRANPSAAEATQPLENNFPTNPHGNLSTSSKDTHKCERFSSLAFRNVSSINDPLSKRAMLLWCLHLIEIRSFNQNVAILSSVNEKFNCIKSLISSTSNVNDSFVVCNFSTIQASHRRRQKKLIIQNV